MKRLLVIVVALGFALPAFAQTGALLPALPPTFLNASGVVASGGKLCTTASGGNTNLATYSDENLTTPLPNPITLNALGQPQTSGNARTAIYIQAAEYRITLYAAGTGNTCNGVPVGTLIWQQDHVYDFAQLANANLVISENINNIRYCNAFSGANAGLKIAACIADLPATGGTADARGIEGAQTISADPFSGAGSKAITLLLGNATYTSSVSIVIPREMRISGPGKENGGFVFTNVGDGFQSTWPINSSTAVNIELTGLFIKNTNVANAGAGFDDVGGTYVRLDRIYFSGWKYDVIFDQTEQSTIHQSDFEMGALATCGLWLVNGPAHTIGANYFFTNNITVTQNQFNSTAGTPIDICDDGGVSHTVNNNNFNGASLATVAYQGAGVSGLVFQGNELEGHTGNSMILTDTITAGIVGPVSGFTIEGNYFADAVTNQISSIAANGGTIKGNTTKGASTSFVAFTGAANLSANVEVNSNDKFITGGFQSVHAFISASSATSYDRNQLTQLGKTYSSSGVSVGSHSVTPVNFEGITLGELLFCVNLDDTNPETVTVTDVSGGTFTATFATSKGPNFLIFGTSSQTEAYWTPVLNAISSPGSVSYSVQTGIVVKRGNMVHVEGALVTTAVGTAGMVGNIVISGLPYPAANIANIYASGTVSLWTGYTLNSGYTDIGAIIEPTESRIRLTGNGSGKTSEFILPAEITADVTELRFSVDYTTSP